MFYQSDVAYRFVSLRFNYYSILSQCWVSPFPVCSVASPFVLHIHVFRPKPFLQYSFKIIQAVASNHVSVDGVSVSLAAIVWKQPKCHRDVVPGGLWILSPWPRPSFFREFPFLFDISNTHVA